MDGLDDTGGLYHPDILAYARNPERWRTDHDARYVIKAYNPVCGDKFEIRLEMNGMIRDTSFFGYGCVVSKASTALLMDMLPGLSVDHARDLLTGFIDTINGHLTHVEFDPRYKPFMIARSFPGRVQCVLLAWEALLKNPVFSSR